MENDQRREKRRERYRKQRQPGIELLARMKKAKEEGRDYVMTPEEILCYERHERLRENHNARCRRYYSKNRERG